jgi:hypothetical protein
MPRHSIALIDRHGTLDRHSTSNIQGQTGDGTGLGIRLLCNEKDINSTEIEVVKEGKGCQTVVGGMLTSIKLDYTLALEPARLG